MMDIKIHFANIYEPVGDYDFYWAKVMFHGSTPESDTAFTGEIQVRIPKAMKNLDEIKVHAVNQAKNIYCRWDPLITTDDVV